MKRPSLRSGKAPRPFRLAALLLCWSLAATAAAAQDVWRALEPGLDFAEIPLDDLNATLTAVRIDPARFDFVLCARSQDGGPARSLSQWGEQYGLAAAINASMYLPDNSTSTGYMRQGGHVNNPRIVRRFGAFFVAGPRASALPAAAILERDAFGWREKLDQYELVIQNYRLLSAGGHVLWSPGGPLYAISAVAEDSGGKILFLHCRPPVEAFQFALHLRHLPLGIRCAMYVEGGRQAGLLVRSTQFTRDLGGLNPAGLLATGDMRAPLPNVLGARRKGRPAPPPPLPDAAPEDDGPAE